MVRLKRTILLITLLSGCYGVHAAGTFTGGELSYEWLQDSTYRFTINLYSPCDSPLYTLPANATVCYLNLCTSGSGSFTLQPQAIPFVLPVPNYRKYQYSGNFTLPAQCADWRFFTSAGKLRESVNLSNGGGNNLYLEATLNNAAAIQPSFPPWATTVSPLKYIMPSLISAGVSNPNGDSFTYTVVQPRSAPPSFDNPLACSSPAGAVSIPFSSASFNLTDNPFATNNTFSIGFNSGAMLFTPGPAASGANTICVRVDRWIGPLLAGSVFRTFQTTVVPALQPIYTGNMLFSTLSGGVFNNTTNFIDAHPGIQVSFCFFLKYDNCPGCMLTVGDNSPNAAPSASISYSGQGTDSVTGCFSWSPSMGDTGLHLLQISFNLGNPAPACYFEPFVLSNYIYPIKVQAANGISYFEKKAVSVSPNPAKDELLVAGDFIAAAVLYAADGRMVCSRKGAGVMDIRTLPAGIYVMKVLDPNGHLLVAKRISKL